MWAEDGIHEVEGIKASEYSPPQNKIGEEREEPILINNVAYGVCGEEIINNMRIISAY